MQCVKAFSKKPLKGGYKMIELILNNPFLQLIIVIVTVVGLPCTLYFGLRNPSKRQFSCETNFSSIIKSGQNALTKLNILYENNPITSVSSSIFTLWNSGKIDIRSSDMAIGKELKIIGNDQTKILDARVLKMSDESNAFFIKKIENNEVEISFDYVNENEGVVIEVIHTSNQDALDIDCKIKGGKLLKRTSERVFFNSINRVFWQGMSKIAFARINLFLIVAIMLFALLLTVSIYNDSFCRIFIPINSITPVEKAMSMALVTWIEALFLLLIFGAKIKQYLGMGIPSSLRKY